MRLPPPIKNTYRHTDIQTYEQTNKHRKRKTSRLRPYVFNTGQKPATKKRDLGERRGNFSSRFTSVRGDTVDIVRRQEVKYTILLPFPTATRNSKSAFVPAARGYAGH